MSFVLTGLVGMTFLVMRHSWRHFDSSGSSGREHAGSVTFSRFPQLSATLPVVQLAPKWNYLNLIHAIGCRNLRARSLRVMNLPLPVDDGGRWNELSSAGAAVVPSSVGPGSEPCASWDWLDVMAGSGCDSDMFLLRSLLTWGRIWKVR